MTLAYQGNLRGDSEILDFLYAAGYLDYQVFMLSMCGNWAYAPFGSHHVDMFAKLPRGDRRGVRLNIISPRSSGKSMIVAQVYPLHRIVYKELEDALGLRSDDYIVLASETTDNSRKRMDGIDRALSFPNMVEVHGRITGEGSLSVGSREYSNGVLLEGVGYRSQVRGKMSGDRRVSLLVVDDLENVKGLADPETRDEYKSWFHSDCMKLGDATGEMVAVVVNTNKHPQSLSMELMATTGAWETLFYRAVLDPVDLRHRTHEHLWERWDLLMLSRPRAEAEAFYEANSEEMEHGVRVLWPGVQDFKLIRQMVLENGYPYVMREHQNESQPSNLRVFDISSGNRFRIGRDGFERGSETLASWEDMLGVSFFVAYGSYDVGAYEMRGAVVAAVWQAIEGRGADSHRGVNCYVLDAWAGTAQLSGLLDRLFRMRSSVLGQLRFPLPMRMGMWQGSWEENVQAALDERRRSDGLERSGTVMEFLEVSDSDVRRRVSSMEPLSLMGRLRFHEELYPPFVTQLRLFPGSYLEGGDALSGAHALRYRHREEGRWLKGRPPRTPYEAHLQRNAGTPPRRVDIRPTSYGVAYA